MTKTDLLSLLWVETVLSLFYFYQSLKPGSMLCNDVVYSCDLAHFAFLCKTCFLSFQTPGGEHCVMTAGRWLIHLESTSCCLPPRAVARLSPGSSSTSIQGSSMCLSLCTTSSRPSPTPAAGYVAVWTAGPCWEHTGTCSSTCTPVTFTSWRITSAQSPRTMSPAPSSAEALATPCAPLPCAWKEGI